MLVDKTLDIGSPARPSYRMKDSPERETAQESPERMSAQDTDFTKNASPSKVTPKAEIEIT